jgi:hypothetical protein
MNKFQQTIAPEKEVKKLNHIDLLRGDCYNTRCNYTYRAI